MTVLVTVTEGEQFVLGFSVVVQLAVFILPAACALWIDQLMNTYLAEISEHTVLYKVLFISSTVVSGLWLRGRRLTRTRAGASAVGDAGVACAAAGVAAGDGRVRCDGGGGARVLGDDGVLDDVPVCVCHVVVLWDDGGGRNGAGRSSSGAGCAVCAPLWQTARPLP